MNWLRLTCHGAIGLGALMGGFGLAARLLAQKWPDQRTQAVTVDNRLGADTIAGRTHLFISPYASAIQWVKDGKAKAIAVTSTPDQMDKLISLEVLNFKKLAAAAQIQID